MKDRSTATVIEGVRTSIHLTPKQAAWLEDEFAKKIRELGTCQGEEGDPAGKGCGADVTKSLTVEGTRIETAGRKLALNDFALIVRRTRCACGKLWVAAVHNEDIIPDHPAVRRDGVEHSAGECDAGTVQGDGADAHHADDLRSAVGDAS